MALQAQITPAIYPQESLDNKKLNMCKLRKAKAKGFPGFIAENPDHVLLLKD